MEKTIPNLKLKTRFFGITPTRTHSEWLYTLVTLEEDEDGALEVIDRKGPYYMIELDIHLQIALGKEKERIFRGVVSVD